MFKKSLDVKECKAYLRKHGLRFYLVQNQFILRGFLSIGGTYLLLSLPFSLVLVEMYSHDPILMIPQDRWEWRITLSNIIFSYQP